MPGVLVVKLASKPAPAPPRRPSGRGMPMPVRKTSLPASEMGASMIQRVRAASQRMVAVAMSDESVMSASGSGYRVPSMFAEAARTPRKTLDLPSVSILAWELNQIQEPEAMLVPLKPDSMVLGSPQPAGSSGPSGGGGSGLGVSVHLTVLPLQMV